MSPWGASSLLNLLTYFPEKAQRVSKRASRRFKFTRQGPSRRKSDFGGLPSLGASVGEAASWFRPAAHTSWRGGKWPRT